MIAVIFEVEPAEGMKDTYLEHAAGLRPLFEGIEGFISVERFQSLTTAGQAAVAVVLGERGGLGRLAPGPGAPGSAGQGPQRLFRGLPAACCGGDPRLRDGGAGGGPGGQHRGTRLSAARATPLQGCCGRFPSSLGALKIRRARWAQHRAERGAIRRAVGAVPDPTAGRT